MHADMDLTGTVWGYACVTIFVLAYALVVLEERLHLRKSIPALVAASAVWILVAAVFTLRGQAHLAEEAFRHNLLDYAELMLFLLAAMTFVNTLGERDVFAALRAQLARRGFSLRAIFWITGGLAFVISPIADNLTTALILGAVALAVGRDRPKFVVVACINVVVAANAGGAFSPFGDITTLMAWQRGVLPFAAFLLAVRSLAGELVGAGGDHVALDRQGTYPPDHRGRRHEERRPGGRGLAPRFDCVHGRHSQRPRPAAGLRNDDGPRRPEGVRLPPRSAARTPRSVARRSDQRARRRGNHRAR